MEALYHLLVCCLTLMTRHQCLPSRFFLFLAFLIHKFYFFTALLRCYCFRVFFFFEFVVKQLESPQAELFFYVLDLFIYFFASHF